jgi:CubicO group peptidase (beta-lactamase class C family)
MNRRQAIVAATSTLLTACSDLREDAGAETEVGPALPSDDAIRSILAQRVDGDRYSVGMAVGLSTSIGRRFVTYGRAAVGGDPVTPDSVFELGSITKVFTALLLAEAVRRGEADTFDDPAASYLPDGLKALDWPGRPVTLADLATHTSGLPNLLVAAAGAPPLTMMESYSAAPADLYRFLSTYEQTQEPGRQFLYSSLGMTLLGHILAVRAGMGYEDLVRQRILRPLQMASTGGPMADLAPLATGHDPDLRPVPHWPELSGSGGLLSSARDLTVFVEAAADDSRSELAASFTALRSIQRPTIDPRLRQALGWAVFTENGRTIFEHSGTMEGFAAYIANDPERRIGVVVLSNARAENVDIGRHLLDAAFPLKTIRRAIPVDVSRLDGYIGRYELPPNAIFVIARQGDALFVSINDSPMLPLYREQGETFFNREIEFAITFQAGADGIAESFVYQQGDISAPGRRID